MKMTFQPKKRSRAKVHGFRARMSSAGGRKVLQARRAKGRKRLSAQAACLWPFSLSMFGLKKNSDFVAVYHSGKSYANKYLIMYAMKNGTDSVRIGISVSKKVGNSVVRHRVTRLLRESFRLNREHMDSGLDIIVVARAAAKDSDHKKMESAYRHLCGLHNIIKESK